MDSSPFERKHALRLSERLLVCNRVCSFVLGSFALKATCTTILDGVLS